VLFSEDSVYDLRGTAQRLFPSDFRTGGAFDPVSLSPAELSSLLDVSPVLVEKQIAATVEGRGVAGLQYRLDAGVFVGMRAYDWVQASQNRLWSMATKVGLFDESQLAAVPATANAVVSSVLELASMDKNVLPGELLKKNAYAFFDIVSSFPDFAEIPALSYIGTALQVIDVISFVVGEVKDANAREKLPLRTPDQSWVDDKVRVRDMGAWMSASLDWTRLALPSFAGRWTIHEAGEWQAPSVTDDQFSAPARWGFVMRPDDYSGDGQLGFMPGTQRALDQIEWPGRWTIVDAFGTTQVSNWYGHYCDFKDKGCLQTRANFRGESDCRQCVSIDALRGSPRIAGTVDENAGLGWDQGTRAVRVGDWLNNYSEAMTDLWGSLSYKNPAIACFNFVAIYDAWKATWEEFFESAGRLWRAHDSYSWRAVVSNFLACGLVSNETGEIGGIGTLLDWRVREWSDTGLGFESKLGLPLTPVPPLHSSIRAFPGSTAGGPGSGYVNPHPDRWIEWIKPTPFHWENGVFKRAIEPSLISLTAHAQTIYESSAIAYLHEKQALHYDVEAGKLRNNMFGRAYENGIRELVNGGARYSVNMRDVVDPTIRALLLDKGVKENQMGLGVAAPPKTARFVDPVLLRKLHGLPPARPIVGLDGEPIIPPAAVPPIGGVPGGSLTLPARRVSPPSAPRRSAAPALLAGAAGLAGLFLLRK
jgi:hypothetical protein